MLSIKEINLLQAQNEGLKKQNAELQKENAKYYQQTLDDEIQINELLQTLQEIKKILLQAMDVKSNAYNHFLKVEQAIDLITKAGEE